ncbi:MAG: 4'-phosphopantetheinyl transferase family protein [Janthinobacterium lividum]
MSSFLHIWQADLVANDALWLATSPSLATTELARQTRLRTLAMRQTYGRAHGFLRAALELYTMQPAKDLHFVVDGYGKPILADFALHFNLSYRAGRALLAVSDAGPVGADVEQLAPLTNAEAMVEELFSSDEQLALRAAAVRASCGPLFYTIWTRKEAYAKALGMGLSVPFAQFSVLAAGVAGLPTLVEPAGACLHSFAVGTGYQGAVALLPTGTPPAPQYFKYPVDF